MEPNTTSCQHDYCVQRGACSGHVVVWLKGQSQVFTTALADCRGLPPLPAPRLRAPARAIRLTNQLAEELGLLECVGQGTGPRQERARHRGPVGKARQRLQPRVCFAHSCQCQGYAP